MAGQDDRLNSALAAVREKLESLRARFGHTSMSVLPDAATPAFTYSIGFAEAFDHPELILVGLPETLCRQLIGDFADLVRAGQRFDADAILHGMIKDLPLAVRPVPGEQGWERATFARELQNVRFNVVQVFVPDEAGLFPWDAGCDPRYASEQMGLFTFKEPFSPQPRPVQ